MALLRLQERDAVAFATLPEVGMGFQLGRAMETDRLLPVIGAEVAIDWDPGVAEQIAELLRRPWMDAALDRRQQEEDFRAWLNRLDQAPPLEPVPVDQALAALPFIFLGPIGTLPKPPQPPASIYGHIPFAATTGADDVYYRYESYPTSRRIDQATQKVAPDTFAAPASELPFMPTGFSAVARCALPSLFPARWRWEIQPVAGTALRCGASVPLYGQSGGGVEVMFPSGAANRGPIANPVVLPIL